MLKKQRYSNPYQARIKRSPFHYLLWQLGYYRKNTIPEIPSDFAYPRPRHELDTQKPSVQWVNHCTFLIEIDGITIITDPIWSHRCSPLRFFGPRRQHAVPVGLDQIEQLDVVLISHNHYDHLDEFTVRTLHKLFPHLQWIIPKGLKGWFAKRGIYRTVELTWWQEIQLELSVSPTPLTITSVPAQHYSGRGLFDFNRSLWMGFVMSHGAQEQKRCYFVGDTAYNPHDFKKIGDRFRKIDLTMCPIGTYEPQTFMRTVHSSPEDAVNIHCDTNSVLSVGMHWKTFKLSGEGLDSPPYELYLEMQKRNLCPEAFLPLHPGEKINW